MWGWIFLDWRINLIKVLTLSGAISKSSAEKNSWMLVNLSTSPLMSWKSFRPFKISTIGNLRCCKTSLDNLNNPKDTQLSWGFSLPFPLNFFRTISKTTNYLLICPINPSNTVDFQLQKKHSIFIIKLTPLYWHHNLKMLLGKNWLNTERS